MIKFLKNLHFLFATASDSDWQQLNTSLHISITSWQCVLKCNWGQNQRH